ncbi:hypothetical protein EUX98_g7381 [Antrodiella citrinella]|uniref:F-box domain-containing protein n=1 Tax=Antrodiella citrinella TaxID=2447956 RepID=A0A4S4MU14_9APHY|nr:hypothetical protein EUX98_g7381 [Antrodiella citrinella]
MDRLPVELLLDIFSYACTDGGYTGCSLSSVSKRIRTTSEHVRYQSLAVYGARHIRTLSFRLTSSGPDSGLRKVHHLLLSDRSLEAAAEPAPYSDREGTGAELVSNITFILTAIAPHLETLLLILTTLRKPTALSLSVLSFLSDLPFVPLIPTNLPFLRELAVASPLFPMSFPLSNKALRLERLHIATHTELPATLGASLRKVAPNLTHFRVSSLRGRTDGGGLLDMLKLFITGSASPSGSKHIPPNLQRVIITPKPTTRSRGEGRVFGTLARDLEQLCQKDALGRVLVLRTADCLKEDDEHEKLLYEARYRRLRADWEDRILGEQGCWFEGSGFSPCSLTDD